MELPFAESWKIKMVEPIRRSTREEREQWLREAHYNVFQLKAEQVYIDLLTDSGTGAMSDRQWSALMMGDESYAGARSFYKLEATIQRLFGMPYVIPTHQGRAAENVLFSYLVKEGNVIPGNAHFDTTKGHIEARKAKAIDVTTDEAKDTQLEVPFKGNVNLEKLEKVLKENSGNVPFMVLTVTNNTVGGQPVSMENIKATCALCHKYGVPVVMDSARFAENAYFIKTREAGYADKSIKEIAAEMYADADAMTMSAKKDGIVNMGGFIGMKRQEWYEGAKLFCIPFEGYVTYGGMNGRDMEALAVGLDENTEFDMLHTRIHQVAYLAKKLDEYGIPYQRPAGGHAIFVDADRVLRADLGAVAETEAPVGAAALAAVHQLGGGAGFDALILHLVLRVSAVARAVDDRNLLHHVGELDAEHLAELTGNAVRTGDAEVGGRVGILAERLGVAVAAREAAGAAVRAGQAFPDLGEPFVLLDRHHL